MPSKGGSRSPWDQLGDWSMRLETVILGLVLIEEHPNGVGASKPAPFTLSAIVCHCAEMPTRDSTAKLSQ